MVGAQLGVKTPSPIHKGAFTKHNNDNGDILSVNDTSDVFRCRASNGSLPPCNFVERVKYLGSGSIVRQVSVLSGDCSSTRDSGDIPSVDDTSDVVQCSDGNGLPPLVCLCGLWNT